MKVLVLHNTGDGMFWEYIPTAAKLSHAQTFDIPGTAVVVTTMADLVYTMCNVDLDALDPEVPEYDQVKSYRARKNRSLSVGDVLVILDGEAPVAALACQRIGWQMVKAEPILANLDLSDIDNHLAESLAFEAHRAIKRGAPPNPFAH